jgi:hypothetical protein
MQSLPTSIGSPPPPQYHHIAEHLRLDRHGLRHHFTAHFEQYAQRSSRSGYDSGSCETVVQLI